MPDGLFANPLHWAILLVIVLIIFGPGKLPSVGNALGKSIREFKKASREDEGTTTGYAATSPLLTTAVPAVEQTIICKACDRENAGQALFCTNCGGSLAKTVEPEPVEVAVSPIVCDVCGTENHRTSRFCAHCGKLLEGSISRV